MKAYRNYAERQNISAETHNTLLELTAERKPLAWKRYAALAACCALVLGAGLLLFKPGGTPVFNSAAKTESPSPAEDKGPEPAEAETGSGEIEVDLAEPLYPEEHEMPAPSLTIDYSGQPSSMAADIALPTGSFFIDFADPEYAHTADTLLETLAAAFPDYEPHARAIYDGHGDLWTLTVYGTAAGRLDAYTLELSPGQIPPTCIGRPESEPTVVDGVEVYGWSAKYDSNGDRREECHCGSQFLAGNYGMRFENIGAPYRSNYNGEKDEEMGGAMEFNARFVALALGGGLDRGVEDLLRNENIPAWEEETYASLEEARQNAKFAPYVPAAEPFSDYEEFSAYYRYQEDRECYLLLHWYKGCDGVDIEIELPEGGQNHTPVDVNVPESYDVRLYDGPWADAVPEEYRLDFYSPAFRAEDMTREIVDARGWEKDTGAMTYVFRVLHRDGASVYYRCDGMTADEVWSMIEPTLK